MEKNRNNIYFEVKDSDGIAVLCPVDDVDRRQAAAGGIDDENCFEKDVMGRYASNIVIEED